MGAFLTGCHNVRGSSLNRPAQAAAQARRAGAPIQLEKGGTAYRKLEISLSTNNLTATFLAAYSLLAEASAAQ